MRLAVLHILDQLLQHDHVVTVAAQRQRGATIRTPRGRKLSVTDMDEIGRRYAAPLAVVHRSHLLEVLRDAVGERALRLGATCTGVLQDDRVVRAQLADGSQIEAEVVVAADGVGSRLRDALIDKGAVQDTGLVAWRAVVPAETMDVEAVAGEAWGRGELFGAAPLTGGRLYWFASSRRSRRGPAGASHCSATPPTPCCPTSAKEAVRRSRTRGHSANHSGPVPRCPTHFAPTSGRANRARTTSPASRGG